MIRTFCYAFAFFESKMIRMKKIAEKCVQVVFGLSAVSCGVSEIGDFEKDETNGVWTAPSAGGTGSHSVVYVTAFDYPDDYDWVHNPEKGSVRCSLVVFADSKPQMKIPVGDAYHVSDDPDMHRVIDGHVYTDFATDAETFIKKDGKPLLSYEGRESVVDMIVCNDSLHTLGHRRNGGGFSYRINGRIVLERDSGYTFGSLGAYGNDVCFAFTEPIVSAQGRKECYYCFRNGKVSQTALREDIKKLWDIDFHKGEVYILVSLTGVNEPVLISEAGLTALPMPYGTTAVSGQIFSAGDSCGVEMLLSSESGVSSALWLHGRLYQSFDTGMSVYAILPSESGVSCVLNARSSSGTGLMFRLGEKIVMPSGFTCMGKYPVDMIDGILTVGLSSLSGERPVVWRDGRTEELDVNGYICNVSSISRD